MIFERRAMMSQSPGGLPCLEALRWLDADGSERFLAIFSSTAPKTGVAFHRDGPGLAQVSDARALLGSVILSGEVADGPLKLPTPSGEIKLETSQPEPHLFAGLDVGLVINNGLPAQRVVDWIDYHAADHGMTGALVIQRAWPDQSADEFAAEIEAGVSAIEGVQSLVIYEAPYPIGRRDLPREDHLMMAPDAPGKDRMDRPPPDPSRAPLGEGAIFEIAKHRFLSQAAGVLSLEAYDILPPRGEAPSVFEAARAAESGLIALRGVRTFPWRVRENDDPQFGDHICTRFDDEKRMRRWCVAPEKAGLDNAWRLVRVSNVTPESAETRVFYRCMAIRHPDAPAAALAPKTSMIEDETLIAFATGRLGHNPVRQPKERVAKAPPLAVDGGYACIVTTMKNEGPFILEWIAYHRAIGVEGFMIYSNDCDDGTDDMLDLLQSKGIVQHRDNPFRINGLKPQHSALQASEDEDIVKNAGWLICMDVDEFLNIHAGEGTLRDLFEAVGEANMISVTWRLFGNSDIHEFNPDLMIRQFDRCAPKRIRKPHQAWGFKTLYRNLGMYKKMGVHRPKGLKPEFWEDIRWVNGSGAPMPQKMLRTGWRSGTDTYGYDLVTLNHYAVRSAESFLVKRDRGRVNHVARDQGAAYWFRMNNNAEQDRSIQRMIPRVEAELERLMADAEIAAAHEHSVRRHREKIAELKARDDFSSFYEDLTSPRYERLSRLHKHFGSMVFHEGPDVVPDEVVSRDLPDDFFFTVPKTEEAG